MELAADGLEVVTRLADADTDGDGLDDSVETDTGIYLSPTNTGTNPLLADSDRDGAGDQGIMFGYATDLRSRTQGRATYTMQFDHYEAAPQSVSEEVIAKVKGA